MMFQATGSMDLSKKNNMNENNIIVISASSDIGSHLVKKFLQQGANVIGTYRSYNEKIAQLESAGAKLFELDILSEEQVRTFAETLTSLQFQWNVLISAPGLLSPIGPFFELDFQSWENSIITNSTAQLRVLHTLYGNRDQNSCSKVVFFAGGGTNSAFDNYSAYCLGKLMLIKIVELLDSEYANIQASSIGTGWVDTKIHQQTLKAGTAAGSNLTKTKTFLQAESGVGTSLDEVFDCVQWCLNAPREAVGGKNFSLVHDAWHDPEFIAQLIEKKDSFKLRRKV